jgi:hypothetical protein
VFEPGDGPESVQLEQIHTPPPSHAL